MQENKSFQEESNFDLKEEFSKYLPFWPWFIITLVIFLSSAFLYLRFANYKFESKAKIQIINDEGDMDIGLPSMPLLSKSKVNLENEIGILSSYAIHKKVVNQLNANIFYYSSGRIKTNQEHASEWLNGAELNFKIDIDVINFQTKYVFSFNKKSFEIAVYDKEDAFIDEFLFDGFSTLGTNHSLPFEFDATSVSEKFTGLEKSIILRAADNVIDNYSKSVKITNSGNESEHLLLSLQHVNPKIANEYLDTLIEVFNRDGISDKQLVHKKTIEFIDSRYSFLLGELNQVEVKKQKFKEVNRLTNISADASLNASQQITYDAELFKTTTQLDLSVLLKESMNENQLRLLPVNIGIESADINNLIGQYNEVVNRRDVYLNSAGRKNSSVIKLEQQLKDYKQNILFSIENYQKSLELNIANFKQKESEFEMVYQKIPKNERELRSIQRELEIKESLFLILLQKREEAAISYAVVQPSIKIIDYARNDRSPLSPRRNVIYLSSIVLALMIPFAVLFIIFLLDSKINNRKELTKLAPNLNFLGEIPFIEDEEILNNLPSSKSRESIIESFRMVVTNLNFVMSNYDGEKGNTTLVTSSIKGEGKTLVSLYIPNIIVAQTNKKVLLIGADLRNPQLHKLFNLDKNSSLGLSDYLSNLDNEVENYILPKTNNREFDLLLAGSIPPNPNQMLASNKFKEMLAYLKTIYDYIIIDSSPCLLVTDTYEISQYVDQTIYIVRAKFTEQKLTDFIKENEKTKKLKNINLVLNGIKSSKYGYKYNYQYNYGYNYGYKEDIT